MALTKLSRGWQMTDMIDYNNKAWLLEADDEDKSYSRRFMNTDGKPSNGHESSMDN